MAKEKKDSTATWIRLAIAILVIATSILIYFVRAEAKAVSPKIEAVDVRVDGVVADVKDVVIKVEVLDEESELCKLNTALMKKDIISIQTSQTALKQDTEEILRRLPKK